MAIALRKSQEIVRYKEADPHSPWRYVGRWRVGGEIDVH
jgi:hypothetical protein